MKTVKSDLVPCTTTDTGELSVKESVVEIPVKESGTDFFGDRFLRTLLFTNFQMSVIHQAADKTLIFHIHQFSTPPSLSHKSFVQFFITSRYCIRFHLLKHERFLYGGQKLYSIRKYERLFHFRL